MIQVEDGQFSPNTAAPGPETLGWVLTTTHPQHCPTCRCNQQYYYPYYTPYDPHYRPWTLPWTIYTNL